MVVQRDRTDTVRYPSPVKWRRFWAGVRFGCASLLVGSAAGSWMLELSPAFAQQQATGNLPAAQATRSETPLVVPASLPRIVPEEIPTSAPEQRLALADLEQMALAGNPSIARTAAGVGVARGNWVQGGLPPNPYVGYEGQQLGSGGLAEQHGIVFGQEVVRGGKLRLNRAVADREVTRAQQELATQQQRVLTDVRVAFFQVLLAQRQIDITSELLRVSSEGVRTVESLFRGLEANRAEVLQAQIEVENAEILVSNARHRHLAAWQELTAVVGNPLLPCQPLAGDAFVPPACFNFDETLARIHMASPEVAVAVAEIDRSRMAVERARVEPVSNVNFQGLFNVVDNGIFGGKPDAGIVATVPVPIFNRNQGAILRAQHEMIAAQRALEQLHLDLTNRLAPTFERYANARAQVERYQARLLPAAKESLELTQRTYEAGEASYLGLLTAQRTFFQTNINYLEAVRALRISEVQLNGFLLTDSLQSR